MKKIFIGQTFKIKKAFTQSEVIIFSNICGDKNPIHWDKEYCKTTIFKKPIVFGMLGASLFSNLLGNNFEGAIYMNQTLKFLKPIFIDEEVEAVVTVESFNLVKDNMILKTQVIKSLTNQIAVDGDAIIKINLDKYEILH